MPERTKILYLDDSATQLQAVRRRLVAEGYDVAIALTVPEAMALLPGCEVVIVDYRMPEMTGAEALPLLRAHVPKSQATSFFLYTSDTAAALDCRAQGFDGAFTQKGTLDMMVSQLASVVKFSKMRRALGREKK
jgi:CheY-like chemotaxis protein